jgi:N-acetylglucosaminyldiphosphoundecaprenol N-acetyl-beta-D-mannosaminyltransferase
MLEPRPAGQANDPAASSDLVLPAQLFPASTRERVRLLGLDLDPVTEAEAIATILRGLDEQTGGFVVTPNLDHLRQLARKRELASLFSSADLVVADGMPLVWASRLRGQRLPERVAGSELIWSLTAEAARRDRSVFLLGGAPGTCQAAEERLRASYPGALFAGNYCPPFGFEYDAEAIERVRERLREARPDIVFVGLGFPKQERLIAYLRSEFPKTWFLGVGYSFSFVAGATPRAPAWMIRAGLEWLHRMLHDPRRLVSRYLLHGLPFAARLMTAALLSRLGLREDSGKPPTARLIAEPAHSTERVVFGYGSLERMRAELLHELMTPELELEREAASRSSVAEPAAG